MNILVEPVVKIILFLNDLLQSIGLPYHFGFAIILLTIIIKVVTLPLNLTQIRSLKAQQELQPKLAELQKKYGKDKERMAQAQMQLYKEAGVNPLGGCLPLIIQHLSCGPCGARYAIPAWRRSRILRSSLSRIFTALLVQPGRSDSVPVRFPGSGLSRRGSDGERQSVISFSQSFSSSRRSSCRR